MGSQPSNPSTNGPNGRDQHGRFQPGNRLGKGNPYAAKVAGFRKALFDAVTPEDLRAIAAMLVQKAREGDLAAAKELLNRLLGPPAAAPDPEQLELARMRLELRGEELEAVSDRAWLRRI